MSQTPRFRLSAIGPVVFVILAALAGALGGTTRSATAQVPSYPTTGPGATVQPTGAPTTTVTIPQMGPYPVVTPTTTVPPTTAAPVATTTQAPPPVSTTPPTTLVSLVGATERFETAREHRSVRVDAGFGTLATYTLVSGPPDAVISTDGFLAWRPGESDGGTTVDFVVRARTPDQQVRDVSVHVLVAETNSTPMITGPTGISAAAGDTVTIKYTANDSNDDPPNHISWSVEGSSDAFITNGLLEWTIDPTTPAGDVDLSIIATDDGEPAMSTTHRLVVRITGVKTSLITALSDDGTPLSPMVIAASGDSAPLSVDLTRPGELMVAVGERTPTISRFAPPPIGPGAAGPNLRRGVAKVLDRRAVVASVQHAYRVLLDLEVPKTAVAGGLAWQLILFFLPGLFTRNDDLFDISGLRAGQEIGDDRFRFRSDATSLRAGAKRRKSGTWMRAVESPAGPIWIPVANLRSSFRGR